MLRRPDNVSPYADMTLPGRDSEFTIAIAHYEKDKASEKFIDDVPIPQTFPIKVTLETPDRDAIRENGSSTPKTTRSELFHVAKTYDTTATMRGDRLSFSIGAFQEEKPLVGFHSAEFEGRLNEAGDAFVGEIEYRGPAPEKGMLPPGFRGEVKGDKHLYVLSYEASFVSTKLTRLEVPGKILTWIEERRESGTE